MSSRKEFAMSLFLPEASNQVRQTFKVYLKQQPPVQTAHVPGDERTQGRSATLAVSLTAALLDWVVELLRHGYSLNGMFQADDLLIDHYGTLKGRYELSKKMDDAEESMTQSDMLRVSEIIESDIYHGVALPEDVSHLVILLRGPYESRFAQLWMMHASTKNDMEKADLYTKIYDIVELVKEVDPNKYDRILAHVSHYPDWILSAIKNLHLHRLLRFRDHTSSVESTITSFLSSEINYQTTLESHMTFRRNGEARLFMDYSPDVGGMRIALKVALDLMVLYNPCIATALGKLVQMPPASRGAATVYTDAAFSPMVARDIASVIVAALAIPYVSEEVAMEAASAAAREVLSHELPATKDAKEDAARAAAIAATLATMRLYEPPYPAVQLIPPGRFFGQDDTDKMFSLIAPAMLHELQYGAFDEGELTSAFLGDVGSTIIRLTAK